jgi:hypothetical protein
MFTKIFSDGEILCMDDEFIEILRRLLDDKVSDRLLQFFDRFDKSGISGQARTDPVAFALCRKVEKLKEALMPTIRQNTFHLEVKQKQIFDFVSRLNIDTALSVIENRQEAIDILDWLLRNRKYWTASIPVRQKQDYEDFVRKCRDLPFAARSMDLSMREHGFVQGVHYYDNLMERLKANKEFFYSPNESKRSTGMAQIMNIVHTLETILQGLRYQELCNQRKIPRTTRRSFSA